MNVFDYEDEIKKINRIANEIIALLNKYNIEIKTSDKIIKLVSREIDRLKQPLDMKKNKYWWIPHVYSTVVLIVSIVVLIATIHTKI